VALETFAEELAHVRARIARAAERSGRAAGAVRLIGASKTVPAERLLEALALGLREFGENRVQEAEGKIPAVNAVQSPQGAVPRWHLIGHLQSNKARRAAALFDVVQSVDSPRIAQALDRHAADLDRRLEVLIEVNTSGEVQKSGVAPADALALMSEARKLSRLDVRGWMTVGPLVERPDDARPAYRVLARLLAQAQEAWPEAQLTELSMGMSGDYDVAIEEGATLVRIGSALFGARR
jgi:pyridoxal phosphate enzyme (YggS family)